MANKYRLAFQVAAVIVPLIMGVVGVVYGDIKPALRDICGVALPGELVQPAVTVVGDAGAPR